MFFVLFYCFVFVVVLFDPNVIKYNILDKVVGFIIPRKSGGFMVGCGKDISLLEWKTEQTMCLAEVDQDVKTRMNDGKCDARGRLWFGEKLKRMNNPF